MTGRDRPRREHGRKERADLRWAGLAAGATVAMSVLWAGVVVLGAPREPAAAPTTTELSSAASRRHADVDPAAAPAIAARAN